MKFSISSKYFIGVLIALFFGVALYLRVYVPYNQVFDGGWIKFTGVDAYYQMRLVDTIVHNFPHLNDFDPFFSFPEGRYVSSIHFFNQMLAAIIWIIGIGSPTSQTVDLVAVYFPAVLGALNVIPVYFVGKVLFGRWTGVIAAGLIGILPGEFLGRSILGFTDYHVVESMFTAIAMLFLILAIKVARQRQLTFHHLNRRDWQVVVRPAVYSLLAGIFLGVYILMWGGALLFVFLIFLYSVIQGVIDHLKGKSLDYLCLVNFALFFVASLVVYLSTELLMSYRASLAIALLAPFVWNVLSRLMVSKRVKLTYYPLAVVGTCLVGLFIFYIANPTLYNLMLGYFRFFVPTSTERTIIEVEPLLFPGGKFSLSLVWLNYTTTLFISLIALGILAYLAVRQNSAEKNLFVVWSLLMLALNLAQRRFGYYFAVNVALLTGCFSWWVLKYVGFSEQAAMPVEVPANVEKSRVKSRKKSRRRGSFKLKSDLMVMCLAVIIIFFAVFFPNFNLAIANTKSPHFAPSDAWYETLTWLKQNTPEPFGNPNYYYELYPIHSSGMDYVRPASAYGVMAWWDYGYWITRVAHRVPNVNPSQDPVAVPTVARFFTTSDERLAREIVNDMGAKYIVIDYPTAAGKFWAMAEWAGRKSGEFFDVYYYREGNKLMPTRLFYPEYYRSTVVRLYNFEGKAVAAPNQVVISWEERVTNAGERYREITSARSFNGYQDALNYVQSQKSGNYKIISSNPFISSVPLEEIEGYKLVFRSSIGLSIPEVGLVSEVKVFEYTGAK